MLRLLGVFLILVICIEVAPWGFVVGAVLLVACLLVNPAPPPKTHLLLWDRETGITDVGKRVLRSIPLVNAVYCADCDLITDSPHDACAVCGSHSVVGVSRMVERSWQPTEAPLTAKNARYKLNVAAELREIPADGLGEITKLITRLAESGGRVERLHINVEPFGNALANDLGGNPLAPVRWGVTSACRQVLRRAS